MACDRIGTSCLNHNRTTARNPLERDLRMAATGVICDLFAKTRLFETDLRVSYFGREPTGLQSLLGFFDGLLRTADIDIFGLFPQLPPSP